MRDDPRGIGPIIAGAIVGGLVGYLFFTDRGRALRRQFEPALEDFARELAAFRSTVQKAINVATETWDTTVPAPGRSYTENVH